MAKHTTLGRWITKATVSLKVNHLFNDSGFKEAVGCDLRPQSIWREAQAISSKAISSKAISSKAISSKAISSKAISSKATSSKAPGSQFSEMLELFVELAGRAGNKNSAGDAALAVLYALDDAGFLAALRAVG
jgi:hypothetical protein